MYRDITIVLISSLYVVTYYKATPLYCLFSLWDQYYKSKLEKTVSYMTQTGYRCECINLRTDPSSMHLNWDLNCSQRRTTLTKPQHAAINVVIYLFEIFDNVFMWELLFLEFHFERAFVFPEIRLVWPMLVLSHFQWTDILCFQIGNVVLMLE